MVATVDDNAEFWLRHIHIGVVLSVGVLAVTVPSHAVSADALWRGALQWSIMGFAAAVLVLAMVAPWRRILDAGRIRPVLIGWTASAITAIVAGTMLDGGHASPLAAVLVIPIIWGSMAFRPRVIVALTTYAIVIDAAGGLLVGEPPSYVMVLRAGMLALIGWMCGASAHSHLWVVRRLRESAARLEQLASVDGLTGCMNHRSFQELLRAEVTWALNERRPLSVLLLDLDHFKKINDTRGHPAGDEVLARTGGVLRDSIRANDIVGRLGGEEFGVLLPGIDAPTALDLAERCRAAIAGSEGPTAVTASAGVATLPDVGTDADALLSAADGALYRAKRAGRDRVVVATAGSAGAGEPAGARLSEMLDGQHLTPVFQPVVELATGRLVGWQGRVQVAASSLSIPDWLTLAGQHGRRAELELAMWGVVLDAWERAAPPDRLWCGLTVSADVLAEGLPATVRDRLPAATVLELGELGSVTATAGLAPALRWWREVGVAVALHGFGAGHASLRDLIELRPEIIGLDRFLIEGITTHEDKRAVVRGVADFCHDRGVRPIAEGITDGATVAALVDLGVALGQGPVVGPASPAPVVLRDSPSPQPSVT